MQSYRSFLTSVSFIFCGALIIICSLAPINLTLIKHFFPDLLFCFIFIFLIRYPTNVSFLAILFLSLLADFFWYRPVGLYSLTTLIASEFVRWVINSREQISLLEEYLIIMLVLIVTTTCQELVKFFSLIPSLAIKDIIDYVLLTLVTYILITAFIKIIAIRK